MLWLFYLIGIGAAILLAKLLRNTVLRGEAEPFIMELPPYRLPTARGLALHAWTRGWMYIRKAGTVILAFSIALWALSAFPRQTEYSRDFAAAIASAEETGQADLARSLERERQSERLAHSAAGRIGAALRPVLDPMGFDWRIGTALLGAFAAKEIFVAQLGVLFAVGDVGEESAGSLRERIRAEYPPLVGFCVMLFCLLGLPCMATVAATWRESGSWRWAAAQFAALTGMAWLVTTAMYQAGRLLGIGI
ncbi:MAG: Ferrous iron transport protein B [candidate division BRC1 bacterium ADurb.BinA364]|nr:MAG: Ferrous iron transport protein B [candidate division BRC1 bacterium ADurb.BinA364]